MRIFVLFYLLSIPFLIISCSDTKEAKKEVIPESTKVIEETSFEESEPIENVIDKAPLMTIGINRTNKEIALKDFENIPNLYGLGIEKGLKGEIQIFNGALEISRRTDETILMDYSFDNSAELFLHTTVESWQSIDIPTMVKSQGQFEIFLRQEAKKAGVDLTKPFPFLLSGYIQKLNWHIVSYDPSRLSRTPEDLLKSGISGVIANGDVEILGFFSTDNEAILAGQGDKVHMHFRTDRASLAGHVKSIFLGPNMTLKLPKK